MEGVERPRDIYTSSTSFPPRLIVSTLLLILQISLHSTALAQDGQIMCDVLPAKLHGNTSLTCHFPEDVSKTKKDFSVYRYTDKSSPDDVLDCWWMLERVECRNDQGYEYNKMISDKLSLKILEVSAPQVYACQLPGYGPKSIITCDLKVEPDKTSCHVPSVKENEPTTFTCTFSVDLRVTRQDVKVIHQLNTGTDVISCTWINEKPYCTSVPGFELTNTITDRLTIKVPRATLEYNGTYVCHLQGSQSEHFESCDFIVMTELSEPHNGFSAAVLVISLLVVIALIVAIVFVMWRRGKFTLKQPRFFGRICMKQEEEGSDETQQMMLTKSSQKEDRKTLPEYFIKMYPDFETKSYLVPPLYFNRNKYTNENIGGQHVYITQPPDEKTAKHDLAMARVLHSLRLLVEQEEQEVMFVISQFNYDYYLATPERGLTYHKLRMPSSLRKKDKHFGDFDILIAHRHRGLLVGVVKVCGDGPEETNDTMIVEELKKGCEQLNNADHMLKHLLSSKQNEIVVHKLLMLPNVSQDRLESVLLGNHDMTKDLATCVGISEPSDLHKEFLCSEHLDDADGINKLKDLLIRRLMRSDDNTPFSVDQYVAIISRFCGPSTHWTLKIPGGPPNAVLSTVFKHSLSMMGDLFRAPVLQPEQWDALNDYSPRVVLTGPPASGKTRMLVLTGIRWMAEGHTVHVVSTCKESQAATEMIYVELSRVLQEKQLPGAVSLVPFEKANITERVIQMTEKAADGSLYIIADEPESYKKQPEFKAFVDRLQKEVPELYLRAASYFQENVPECCKTQAFTKSLTCPPSILLQEDMTTVASECGVTVWSPDMRTTAPTEGPPIKFVYHSNEGHNGSHPGVCGEYATEVEEFLQTLHICIEADCSRETEGLSHLHYKDILILFEITDDPITTPIYKVLMDAGIKVKVLDKDHPVLSAMRATNDEVLITRGRHVLGIKKKVVIYVQGKWKLFQDMPQHWKRLRGLTSCTSQLVWVRTKTQ